MEYEGTTNFIIYEYTHYVTLATISFKKYTHLRNSIKRIKPTKRHPKHITSKQKAQVHTRRTFSVTIHNIT